MQRGNVLIFLLVGIVVLAAIGGAFYLGRSTTPKPSPTPVATSQTPQPTPSPTPNIQIDSNMRDQTNELNGFPIYQGSVFFEKKYHPQCDEDTRSNGYSTCDVVTYTFEARDDFDQVSTYYSKVTSSSSEWVCSGGVGSHAGPRDAFGRTLCKKGNHNYSLDLSANSVKTSISINVPLSDYKGGYLNK